MNFKNPKLVYIEWCDAVTNRGWFSRKEIEEWKDTANVYMRHAGWLIEETKEHIILADAHSPGDPFSDEKFLTLHKIPTTWIRKRKVLKV